MRSPRKPKETIAYDDIKQALIEGKLSPQDAMKMLTSNSRRPWHTKEWRQQRDKLIDKQCFQCSSNDGIMVLQHLWHPKKISIIIRAVRWQHKEDYEKLHPKPPVQLPPEPEPVERPACPSCNTTNVYQRRKMADWRCNSTKCGHIFITPATKQALTLQQRLEYGQLLRNAYRQAYSKWEEEFSKAEGDKILTDALLISIKEHERYVSCQDTVTFCKKCAFMWDKKYCKLCPVCKKHYTSFMYPTCYACSKLAASQ